MTIDTSKQYTATITTTTGTFTIALDAKAAPVTVNNFVFLADKGYFNCGSFFRVITGQVVQTGNPAQTNTGKEPGYTIPDELPAKAANPAQQYPAGTVAMANTGSPNTGGSQFFIVTGPEYESLPNAYSTFGVDRLGHERRQHHQSTGFGRRHPSRRHPAHVVRQDQRIVRY